ncbi:MAG: hypothetical protein V1694_12535 [Candidatus Eisenbacteria bacterium]
MCCDPKDARRRLADCECIPICCESGGFARRFRTSKEEAERLEEYKAELEKEIAAVAERIQELKRK